MSRAPILAFTAALLLFLGCKKGQEKDNIAPTTFTVLDTIALSGDERLNSSVTLQWWGTDSDGAIAGFEFSFDGNQWEFTTEHDSTFLFNLGEGGDSADIEFWVRAVDTEGAADLSPAYLVVPIRNSPPLAAFNYDLAPADSALLVLTVVWSATDPDGDATLKAVDISANGGPWLSISPIEKQLSLVPNKPTESGPVTCTVHFDENATTLSLEGIELNAWNTLYLRATDAAGAFSAVDTLPAIYLVGQSAEVLLLQGNGNTSVSFYTEMITAAGSPTDALRWSDESWLPRVWNPTVALLLRHYDKAIITSSELPVVNPQTSAEEHLFEFAAEAISSYTAGGGKLWLNAPFQNNYPANSGLFGVLPVDSFSSSTGQARLPVDSMMVGAAGFPSATCGPSLITGLDPFYASSDAEPVHNAQLTTSGGWQGPTVVGARRRNGANTYLLYHSVELHRLAGDEAALTSLFNHVLNNEFGW